MTDWWQVDLASALGILERWADHRVVVSVDLPSGAGGLARLAGVLHPPRRDDGALALELAGPDASLRLPTGPWFRGASFDEGSQVLVLEFSSDGRCAEQAVLVDIQLACCAGGQGPS